MLLMLGPGPLRPRPKPMPNAFGTELETVILILYKSMGLGYA